MEKKLGSAAAWTAGVAAAVALAACGGGGGGGSAEMGTVSMSLIDASCGYKNVWVNVKEVRIQKSPTAAETDAGWTSLVPAGGSRRIDLLNLTNGTFVDLGAATVEAGTYSQLRLVLEDTGNEVVLDSGATQQLKTPSAQQSGLKIKSDYTVAPNTTSTFVLDFDACKSIVVAGNSGQYILKPVVRLTQSYTGSIVGYATAGANVSAQTAAGEVERNTVADSTGKFVLPYVMPGTYTVVMTKDAFATGVVTSVPVGTTTTTLNTSTTTFALTTSAMSTVAGTVTGAVTAGGLIDASVAATQTLTGGPTIVVKETNVDASTGAYSLSLPVSPPKRAAYSTTTTTLAADTAVADKYTLKATSPGKATQTSPVLSVTTPQTYSPTFP